VPAAQAASGAAATVSNPVVSEPRPADPGAANGAPGGSPDAAGAPPKSTAYPFTELEAKWQAHPCPARARLPRRGASRRGLPSVCCPVRQRQRVTTAACNSCVMPLCVWRPRTCCHATTGPCSRAPTGCEPRAMRASDWPACAQAASAGGSRGGATAHSVCQQREARRAGVLAGDKKHFERRSWPNWTPAGPRHTSWTCSRTPPAPACTSATQVALRPCLPPRRACVHPWSEERARPNPSGAGLHVGYLGVAPRPCPPPQCGCVRPSVEARARPAGELNHIGPGLVPVAARAAVWRPAMASQTRERRPLPP